MSNEDLQPRALKINTLLFIKKFEKIVDKESNLVDFVPNEPQMKLYNAIKEQTLEHKPVRIVILKARQMGFSTMTGGVFLANTITHPNKKTVIVAHEDSATNNLFEMYKRFNKYLPPELKHEERANNAKAIIWDTKEGTGLESSIICKTASNEGLGAGNTINNLHISEFGLWKCTNPKMAFASIMQCVPKSNNSMVIIESTARGFNHFYDMCEMARQGKGGWKFLFVAWWEMKEYSMPYSGFELTSYEEDIKRKYNLTNDQLEWRRWCIETNCFGDVDIFNQEYPGCPEDAFISSGTNFFSNMAIAERRKQLTPPLVTFDFTYESSEESLELRHIDRVINKKGNISVYEEPIKRHPYVIGCDTAGDGSDYFVAQVIDNITGKQVCTMRACYGERKFVEQLYCLGLYYNTALIGIETNFSSYPTTILSRMDYPKMYIRQSTDRFDGTLQKSYGFRTTARTRPVALGMLQDMVSDNMQLINDAPTLAEMLVFVKDENGKPQAMAGMHDDCVMALAIAYYCAEQQDNYFLPEEDTPSGYKLPIEFIDDRENSNAEGDYIEWNN